ncbi:hypothetical protein SAMN04488061_3543 [Filomicrobium insigne]|uniref:Uncharacterized protein n=1 Tax=Filomicrobium insigne TaxID=418854 RepID=A0A1H0UAJ7_9HYPH|nr:hypothetical protein [Filomicrobium insigne]SDP63025.1 hypothetical protein SAMN04488061_3543 [Filomicrobium insigne]
MSDRRLSLNNGGSTASENFKVVPLKVVPRIVEVEVVRDKQAMISAAWRHGYEVGHRAAMRQVRSATLSDWLTGKIGSQNGK